jgi:predicted transcriptional regulator
MSNHIGRISVSVDPSNQARIDTIANSLDRSRSWIVNEAIGQYADTYEHHAKLITMRLQMANQPDAQFISAEEVAKRLKAVDNT